MTTKIGQTFLQNSGFSSISGSFDATGADYIRFWVWAQGAETITTITFGGQTLSLVASSGLGVGDWRGCYQLVAPPSGSQAVSVVLSGTSPRFCVAISAWSGVDQSTPSRTPTTASDESTTHTFNPVSDNGDVIEALCMALGTDLTLDTSLGAVQIQSQLNWGSTFLSLNQAYDVTEDSPFTWTQLSSNDGWMVAVPIISSAPSTAPTISNVDGDNIITSTQTGWVITGTNFDNATVTITQGSVVKTQTVNSQNATTINCNTVFDSGTPDLKYGAATLRVTNADTQFVTQAITITVPSGRSFVDIGTPNAIADNRITAVADLASGDQLEMSNVVGGVIGDVNVNTDATFDVAEAVTSFDVRAWAANDQTWGAPGTQTLGSTPAPDGENYVGGTLVDGAGIMQTIFLADGVPVPGTAKFLNGIAHTIFGERYVALWPGSGIVTYNAGRALRTDGAQCIVQSAPTVYLAGFGFTNRGELCVTTVAGSNYVQGFNVNNGRTAVSNVT